MHRGTGPWLGFVDVFSLLIPIALMCSHSIKMSQSSSYLVLRKFLTYIGLHIKI